MRVVGPDFSLDRRSMAISAFERLDPIGRLVSFAQREQPNRIGGGKFSRSAGRREAKTARRELLGIAGTAAEIAGTGEDVVEGFDLRVRREASLTAGRQIDQVL